jgi:hypothetical protein
MVQAEPPVLQVLTEFLVQMVALELQANQDQTVHPVLQDQTDQMVRPVLLHYGIS